MSKIIEYDSEARSNLKKGIDQLATAVKAPEVRLVLGPDIFSSTIHLLHPRPTQSLPQVLTPFRLALVFFDQMFRGLQWCVD